MYTYIEGNEELLEAIYPIIDKIFQGESCGIKRSLEEKARWGSLRIIIGEKEGKEYALGIAHVNNLNTGHIEYVMVPINESEVTKEIQGKLEAWLKWLKVKSITVEREVITW